MTFLKIFLVLTLLFSCIFCAFCCGPYFGFPEDTISFFESSVVADPFFYSYMFKFSQSYGITVTEDAKENSVFDEEISLTNEWKDYFAKNYKDKVYGDVIKSMLFDDSGKTANYVKKLLKLTTASEVTTNGAINVINSNGDKDLLEYLNFMYDINALFSKINGRYSWEEVELSEKEKESDLMNKFLEYAKLKIRNIKNDFLHLRYSYQAIKIFAYLEKFDELITFYGEHVSGIKSNSLIKYRCLGYRAMAYYRTDDLTNALNDYLFVFDQCAPLMETVRLSLDSMNISDKKWQEYITKDDDKSRRINSYFLWSSKDERTLSFDIMEKMVNINPASSKPEVLLVRSIQSIEKYFPKGKDFTNYVKTCERISKTDKVRQPALWLIAGTYLSFLNGKANEADRLYALADSVKGKKESLNSQVALIGTLLSYGKNDFLLNADVTNRFIDAINWAKTLNGDKNNNGIYHSILAFVGNKLLEQGNLPNAVMCFLLCGGEYGYIDREVYQTDYMNSSIAQYLLDVYATDQDLNFIEDVFRGNARFDLFANFKEFSTLKLNDIIYLRGIKEFRSENFDAAIVHFKKHPLGYKQVNFSRSNIEIEQKAKYEKMDIVAFSEMMGKIKAALLRNNDDESKYFELGNIYYTVEMLGFPDIARRKKRSWGIDGIYGKKHSYDFNEITLFSKPKKYKMEKYDAFIVASDNFLKAEKNYAKVIEIGNNKELAAKSCILINTCRNNYLYVLSEDDGYMKPIDYKKPDKNMMKYFLLLKNYKDTKFYGDFIKECPLIEEFY